MAKFILQISEKNTKRIAIYSPLQGYRLMYLMNKKIGSYFVKITRKEDLLLYEGEDMDIFFEVFRWDDKIYYQKWICIKNKLKKEERNPTLDTINPVSYWDKKHKKADFILELEEVSADFDTNSLMMKLKEVPGIIYTQEI